IGHKGFAFLNIMSPCVTWRGDDQHKELRAKVRAVAAEHDRTNRDCALHYTNEYDVITTGILYEAARPTLVDEMLAIRWKGQGDAEPPGRAEMLKVFAPAF